MALKNYCYRRRRQRRWIGISEERLHGHIVITIKPSSVVPFAPCNLCVYPEPIARPVSRFKTLSYLDRLWIKEYARSLGCADALTTNGKGYVLETAFSNIFWRMKEGLYIPDPALELLYGISLKVVEKVAKSLNLAVHYVCSSLQDIPKDAQLFTCNALSGPCPVVEVEGERKERDLDFENMLFQEYKRFVAGLGMGMGRG